jgi:hypothetical protein
MAKPKIKIDMQMFGGIALGAGASAFAKKIVIDQDFFKRDTQTPTNQKFIKFGENVGIPLILGAGAYYYGHTKKMELLMYAGLGAIANGVTSATHELGITGMQEIVSGMDYQLEAPSYDNVKTEFMIPKNGMNGIQRITY